jgi:hypothetical protein
VQVAANASAAELIKALSVMLTAPFDPTQIITPPSSLETNFSGQNCKMCTSPDDAVALAQPVSEFIGGAYIGKRTVVQPTVHITIERDSASQSAEPTPPQRKVSSTDKEEVEDLKALGIGSPAH